MGGPLTLIPCAFPLFRPLLRSVLSVGVMGRNRISGAMLRGKLHLIDLAGSERVSRSGAEGDRLKEAQNINKSLSALGDVIESRSKKKSHTPYRNSVLTFMLKDSLGGDSKTLMFCNVNPLASSSEETICTLNFATRARSVELGKVRHRTWVGRERGLEGRGRRVESHRCV